MRKLDLIYFVLCIFGVIVVGGCGGGASVGTGGSGTRMAAVKVSVNWAARSRALNGQSSALSVVITLRAAAQDGSDFSFTVNRAADPGAYVGGYTSTAAAVVGTWNMVVSFNALADGAGATVGRAAAQITLNTDGSGIGEIATIGTVSTVTIPDGQTVQVGQTKDLVFTAKDGSGFILPVTPGSAFLAIVSGSDKIQLVNGLVKGLAVGNSTLTATIDGITSAAATVTVAAAPTSATFYDVAGIGPGGTSDAVAFNENGQGVGSTPTFAFFFNGTSALNYAPLITAVALNDSGVVAGSVSAGNGKSHAATRFGIIIQDLGTLPNGTTSRAAAISSDGTVVGVSDIPRDPQFNVYNHGFIRLGVINTDLGTLPGMKNSRATDINDDHLVVGISENTSADAHAFLWNSGRMTDLGPVYDGDGVYINKNGQIAFTAIDTAGVRRATLWQNAVRTDLGANYGATDSGVTGINSQGVVTGYSFKTGQQAIPTLFQDGIAIAIAGQIATNGWSLLSVKGINDKGQIVGQATGIGINQAVLLTPR
jgi:probable HAF family extracellular repeat protein